VPQVLSSSIFVFAYSEIEFLQVGGSCRFKYKRGTSRLQVAARLVVKKNRWQGETAAMHVESVCADGNEYSVIILINFRCAG